MEMASRLSVSAVIGLLIAAALLWLMQWMVIRETQGIRAGEDGPVFEFVRLRHETETPLSRRAEPEKPPEEKKPPPQRPELELEEMDIAAPQQDIPLTAPQVPLAFDVPFLGPVMKEAPAKAPVVKRALGQQAPGKGALNRDFMPLSRMAPKYPFRAERRGIEGWVKLSFLITEAGKVQDIVLLESSPQGVFDNAAMQAVARWRFKPRISEGKSVAVRVEQTVNFQLDRDK